MAPKLFNAICRNCGGKVQKAPASNGVKPLTCPICGYTDLYPFDYTGPHEEPEPEKKEPEKEPENKEPIKPLPHK